MDRVAARMPTKALDQRTIESSAAASGRQSRGEAGPVITEHIPKPGG
jgi:hypothetical protein